MKKVLVIDLETYSYVDFGKCSVYAYVENPCFEILLMAYSFDDEETKIIDLLVVNKSLSMVQMQSLMTILQKQPSMTHLKEYACN